MNKIYLKKLCCSFVLIGLLGGCTSQFATNGEKLYMYSKNGPGVNIPPPLTDANISPFYNLPTRDNRNLGVSIAPPVVAIEENTEAHT